MEDSWASLIQTLAGHSSGVTAIAFSPDRWQIASRSGDKTIKGKLWDVAKIKIRSILADMQSPEFESLEDLRVSEQWITYGAMPVFLLSSDFVPRCHDVRGDQVTIGFGNSRVLSFDIDRISLNLILKSST